MNSSVPDLVARDLSFSYDGARPLVRNVNLRLRVGELVVILGENACGKSTLLRLLCGALPPSSGSISIHDDHGTGVREFVGMVFQNPDHQLLAPTVEAELALGHEFRNRAPAEIRIHIDAALEQFRLDDLRHRPPHLLSGGQKQRLVIASMISLGARFLLFDEPDSHLDARSRKELFAALSQIRATTGILWTTPHLDSLPPADRLLLLENGTLRELPADMLRSGHLTPCR